MRLTEKAVLGGAALTLALLSPRGSFAVNLERVSWAWDAPIVLHFDNHCSLLGQGKSVDELTGMLKGIPIARLQVSAYGEPGIYTTYQTDILRHPNIDDWDTLAVWKQVAQSLGVRFHVYLNPLAHMLCDKHPEWAQRTAKGEMTISQRGRPGMCARPGVDGQSGFLEEVMLP
ncbi:MAG: hypothetical protein NTW86_16190, partial [Candidatus Sumerlaeota bacterium]|nr:hypothetical protein [Candidatus Sumerlaeota bacterium]